MTLAALQALLPLIVLAVAAIVTMLVIGLRRDLLLTACLSLLGLLLALAALPFAASAGSPRIAPLLIVDTTALFYMGLIFAASFVVAVLSYGYMKGRIGQREEFFVLLLIATLGAAVIVASSHFASFLLGLEVLSVALYVLIAYTRLRAWSVEAGMKYLVLASASVAFLLLGMAFVYVELGTMEFSRLAAAQAAPGAAPSALLLAGTVLLVVGFGFKLAVVPFHMWTPDVYEGAPAPVTAFVATVSKGAVFALLLRYFAQADIGRQGALFVVFSLIAIASMLAGNLLALLQTNVKRMLAYSSIAHLGYLLVAFLAGGSGAVAAGTFYLVSYFVTTLGAFGVVTALSGRERDADSFARYSALVWRRPYLATAFTAMLLSLAGIPLTAGFIAKFYVVLAGVGSSLWLLVIVLVLASVIGFFYYLRLLVSMYTRSVWTEALPLAAPSLNPATGLVLAALTVVLFWLGIYPAPFVAFIQALFANAS